jgi:hypothetical protein
MRLLQGYALVLSPLLQHVVEMTADRRVKLEHVIRRRCALLMLCVSGDSGVTAHSPVVTAP